jgi:hypothetical protein
LKGVVEYKQKPYKGGEKMEEACKKGLQSVLAGVEDPRIDRTKRHLLLDIILIANVAGICGADSKGNRPTLRCEAMEGKTEGGA